VLSVAGTGDRLLVSAFAFGRLDNGVFTLLPGTTPQGPPVWGVVTRVIDRFRWPPTIPA
jgi:hypothetical protein